MSKYYSNVMSKLVERLILDRLYRVCYNRIKGDDNEIFENGGNRNEKENRRTKAIKDGP